MLEESVLQKLAQVEQRYEQLNELMAQPDVATDITQLQILVREQNQISGLVDKYRTYMRLLTASNEAQTMLNETDDAEMRALAQDELTELTGKLDTLDAELKLLLLPRDPNDDKDVVVEVRAGEGGDEAGLFAAELYRMYSRYAELHGWKTDLVNGS
jgi:peptide chain release factor 1